MPEMVSAWVMKPPWRFDFAERCLLAPFDLERAAVQKDRSGWLPSAAGKHLQGMVVEAGPLLFSCVQMECRKYGFLQKRSPFSLIWPTMRRLWSKSFCQRSVE